ncbi:Mitochondrial succinate-fumarate transporter [Aspergillus fumigatus]
MAAKSVEGNKGKKPASAAVNLIAGGGAGMMEALVCHPLGKAIIQRYRVLKAELTISQIPSKSECSSRDGLGPLG